MREDGVDQYNEYRDTGDDTDPEDQHMQVKDPVTDIGNAFPEIQGIGITCDGSTCTQQYERTP
jgi:hypothetical protein